jgi:hypothetical protein
MRFRCSFTDTSEFTDCSFDHVSSFTFAVMPSFVLRENSSRKFRSCLSASSTSLPAIVLLSRDTNSSNRHTTLEPRTAP